MAVANLTDPQKAVLFLLSLDEDVAAPIVNELDPAELRKLREIASSMQEVSSSALDETYKEFVERSGVAVAVPKGGLPYMRRLTRSALQGVPEDPIELELEGPLQRLESAPPESVAALLAEETDQLVAALLARLDPKRAAPILEAMPTDREASILMRMTKLTDLPVTMLDDVAAALAADLPQTSTDNSLALDGVKRAADILNSGGRQMSASILEAIEEKQPELARDMRLAMFTFVDLSRLDAKSMRTLLREVPTERLTIALKGAPQDVIDAIFLGLSERAAALIRDDLEVLGKVRKAEVEGARQEVVQVALRLEADGVLDLGRGGDE
jgi:flagellar motor switch protein FliG